jgi:DNA polymerase-1
MSYNKISNDRLNDLWSEIESDNENRSELNLNSKILIIDGLNTFIRSFSANPAINDDGIHVGGLVGFLKSLRFTIARINPTRCIIVFDGKNGSKKRRTVFEDYKKQRRVRSRLNRNVDWAVAPMDEHQSMKKQIGRLVRYLEQLPITIVTVDNIEADDAIAYITQNIFTNSKNIIMSTDKDFLQLVNENTTVWSPMKKFIYDKKRIKDEFGLMASNFIIYKILNGDKSDNINGVPGAGLKSIIKNIPEVADHDLSVMELIDLIEKNKNKNKFFEKASNNYSLIKRNYLLMQLQQVDISNTIKLKIQDYVNNTIPGLTKYKFTTMFMQDKLWSQIPDMNLWITEFLKLERYRKLDDK